jgi:hypothetical protein
MKVIIGLLLVIMAPFLFHEARAEMQLVWHGKIIYIENGWHGEGLAIHMSTNGPPGCSAELNDFAIDRDNLAYKELTAMALASFTSDAEVELIVDPGVCTFGGRTKVVSIRMKK